MERKRQRKQVDYTEHEDSIGPEIHRTSEWKSSTVMCMNINVLNADLFTLKYDTDDIIDIADSAWCSPIDVKHLNIEPGYKTLVLELKRIYDANNSLAEHYIDTYTNTLLYLAGFNQYPLSVNLQHVSETELGEDEVHISSVPDFVVKSETSKTMIIVEDKNSKHARYTNQWMENQVLGEMFVAGIKQGKSADIYAIRIIGTLFTFYKANITPGYIKDVLTNLIPKNECMDVGRYPDPGDNVYKINALDFCKTHERRIILECFNQIKQQMEDE